MFKLTVTFPASEERYRLSRRKQTHVPVQHLPTLTLIYTYNSLPLKTVPTPHTQAWCGCQPHPPAILGVECPFTPSPYSLFPLPALVLPL